MALLMVQNGSGTHLWSKFAILQGSFCTTEKNCNGGRKISTFVGTTKLPANAQPTYILKHSQPSAARSLPPPPFWGRGCFYLAIITGP